MNLNIYRDPAGPGPWAEARAWATGGPGTSGPEILHDSLASCWELQVSSSDRRDSLEHHTYRAISLSAPVSVTPAAQAYAGIWKPEPQDKNPSSRDIPGYEHIVFILCISFSVPFRICRNIPRISFHILEFEKIS